MIGPADERAPIPPVRTYRKGFLACLAAYLVAVVLYGWYAHEHKRAALMEEVDHSLLLAASGLKYMLAPDFHDRAVAPGAISFEEELRNRRAVTDYSAEAGFKWAYTLAEKDGKFYFSAPSVSAEEARERHSWYFYPYDDIPPEFVQAFASGKPAFVEYSDQWGRFRSVALPQRSPGGRPYLACADLEISHLRTALRRNTLDTLLTVLFFTGCAVPFVLLFRAHSARLRTINADLAMHRDHLDVLVTQRTRELEEGQAALRATLAQVDTLQGLLPICANCKKIRDAEGCWHPLERYVEDHSQAEFTHGVCPHCARRLYPELDL